MGNHFHLLLETPEPNLISGMKPAIQPLDGASLTGILTGEKESLDRDSLFWHFPGYMDVRNHPRSLIQKRIGKDLYKLFFNYTDGSYELYHICLLYTSPSPRDQRGSRMPSSA